MIGLMLITIASIFVGCGEDKADNRFYLYKNMYWDNYGNGYRIIVDKETNVLYIKNSNGMTVLLDADGKPMKDTNDWKTIKNIQGGDK
jgi:hypothetical protein